MPEILVQSPDGSKRTVHVDSDRVAIGRSRESEIYLPGEWLSRRHAEIQKRPDGYYLVDLKSKNGTLLNGQRVSEQRLAEGDEIVLGEHHLTFVGDPQAGEDADFVPPGTQVFTTRDVFDPGAAAAADTRGMSWERRFLGVFSGAAAALFTHQPLAEIFEEILTLLLEAVPGAERAAILLMEGAQPVIKASRSRKGGRIASVSRSIARKVVEEKVVLLVPNVLEDVAFKAQESILATGIRSALCAPLWFRPPGSEQDVVIGLVYLDTRRRSDAFAEDDRPVVTALANVAAAKIENARLLEESLEKRRMEDDIRMAAEIQSSLLPREAPRVPGYDLMGSTRPCHAVGGDYFDLMTHEGRLLIALGDVSGKGTGAALLMTMLRASVRAHWKGPSVAQAMALINQTVCENTPGNKYITFFMAQLDQASGSLQYVNAGHNPPILCRADGRVEKLTEGGVVLGLIEGVSYTEGGVDLERGDTLIVYSDGVSETWSPEGDEFGDDRVADIVKRGLGLDARALEAEVLRQLEAFSRGARATDDRTLIILKRV